MKNSLVRYIFIFLYKNQGIIIKVSFIIIFMLLLYFNRVTMLRVILFFFILLFAYLYKKFIGYANSMPPVSNATLLLVLIKIDSVKLMPISLIASAYVLFYNLSTAKYGSKIFKAIFIILKSLCINPALLVLHKFYSLLRAWVLSPFRDIIISRLFGLVLAVLVFSPLLSYIYLLLGRSFLNLYILIVFISVLHDNISVLGG